MRLPAIIAAEVSVERAAGSTRWAWDYLSSLWLSLSIVCPAVVAGEGHVYADEEAAISTEGLSDLSISYLRFGQEDYVKLFEAGAFVLNEAQKEAPSLRYRLFIPRKLNPDMKYPLIVWVHGFGDQETTDINRNTGQLKHTRLIFKNLDALEEYPFYFLAAQNQQSADWFAKSVQGSDKALLSHGEVLLKLIDETIARHRVDPSRVTMVGISSGATAAWELGGHRPDLFAGIAPLASVGGNLDRLKPLVGVPVWAFHTERDNPEGDRRTVDHLRSLGGCAQLTLNTGKEHDCWTAAFSSFGLLDWLLARRKGEACPVIQPTLAANVWAKASSAANYLPAAITLLAMFAAIACLLRPPARLKRLFK